MTSIQLLHPDFHQGDAVVLASGTYQGTSGTFLHLHEDTNWADITETNGSVRCHPVAWLKAGGAPATPRN